MLQKLLSQDYTLFSFLRRNLLDVAPEIICCLTWSDSSASAFSYSLSKSIFKATEKANMAAKIKRERCISIEQLFVTDSLEKILQMLYILSCLQVFFT